MTRGSYETRDLPVVTRNLLVSAVVSASVKERLRFVTGPSVLFAELGE